MREAAGQSWEQADDKEEDKRGGEITKSDYESERVA